MRLSEVYSSREVSGHKPEMSQEEVPSQPKECREHAQTLVEKVHERAKGQIIEKYGKYMPDESKERIKEGVSSIEATEYDITDDSIGWFRYNNGKSQISISILDEDQIERTTQHETNHFASYNKEITNQLYGEETGIEVRKKSGIHELRYKENHDGDIIEYRDINRGFNEGITQMFTVDQLSDLDPIKGEMAYQQNGYKSATELAGQLKEILGTDIIAKAYYGGEVDGLRARIDKLAGIGSFDRLSKNMDRVTYSRDYVDRWEAMSEAQNILADMYESVLEERA